MFSEYFFRKIDNSALSIFRILFGLLIMAESWGAIFTGWVTNNLVEPKLSFTFIGFEWLNEFLGPNMYYYYGIMGLMGLFITLGFAYRLAMISFATMWTLSYWMQKTSYNNHYYLFLLISWMMTIIPAHQFLSVDSFLFPKIKRLTCKNWVRVFFIVQMFIVYTFAALNKIYPDWFNGIFLNQHFIKYEYLINNKFHLDGLAKIVGSIEFAQVIAWLGFFFDLLIVPAMLFSRTRSFAIKCAIFFHVFNSFVFGIGIFPFFSLAMMIFFYDPDRVQEIFFKSKSFMMDRNDEDGLITSRRIIFSYALMLYFAWQVYLPVRHLFIPGNVFWTEEGHRMAWRMMLRRKSADVTMYVSTQDKKGKYSKQEKVNLSKYLTFKQESRFAISPDMIWQMAQFIKADYEKKGIKNVQVFADCKISLNGSPYYQFTNPKVNLADVKWSYFGHQNWLKNKPKELEVSFVD